MHKRTQYNSLFMDFFESIPKKLPTLNYWPLYKVHLNIIEMLVLYRISIIMNANLIFKF